MAKRKIKSKKTEKVAVKKTPKKRVIKKSAKKKTVAKAAVVLTPAEMLNSEQREFAQLFMQFGNARLAGEVIWPYRNDIYYSNQLNNEGIREYIKKITASHNELIDRDWLINRLAYEASNPENPSRDRIAALNIFANALMGGKSGEGGGQGLLPSPGDSVKNVNSEDMAEKMLNQFSIEELEQIVFEEEVKEVEVINGKKDA